MMEEKRCTGCGEMKPLDEFHRNRNPVARGGRVSRCRQCESERNHLRYAVNREQVLERNRQRYADNLEQERERGHRYRTDNLEKERERSRRRYEDPIYRAQQAEYQRERCADLRTAVFDHYGTTCSCPGCDVADLQYLTIDHPDGNGRQHREELFGNSAHAGYRFYRWLRDNGWPAGYVVLCFRCNPSKGATPHCRIDHFAEAKEFAEVAA